MTPDLRTHHANGLRASDFTCIAAGGFGDGHNSYAHSMAWFRDALYVGTSRDLLALLKLSPPPKDPSAMKPWPVSVPDTVEKLPLEAEIWRWLPEKGGWKQVHKSPLIRGRTGKLVPRDIGYRGMTIFQGRSDPAPCLYIAGISSASRGSGARLLRSVDGHVFEAVSPAGLGNPGISTLRAQAPFDGYLYVAPAGEGKTWNTTQRAIILRSNDPVNGVWEPACSPGFGDPTNTGIFELQVFNDHLYAGTFNNASGSRLNTVSPATVSSTCR